MNKDHTTNPPHAPDTGGRISRLLGKFHVTGVFWFRLHCWGLSILPEWGVRVINTVFTAFFFLLLRKIRKAISNNLAVVLGRSGWVIRQQRIWRTMLTFSWCLSERYESMITDRDFSFNVDGVDVWNEVTSGDLGFVMVTSHIGHWEIGSKLPIDHGARRVHVVREKEMDPNAQEFIRDLFNKTSGEGYEVIFADERDPSLGPRMLHALRDGDVVALQGDRPRVNGRTERVALFGHPFDLPVGPVALARAADVPLVPVFTLREGRRKARVFIRPAIRVEQGADRNKDFQTSLQAVADEIEWAINKAPHQWFCFRDLWGKTTAPSVGSPFDHHDEY